MPRKADRDKDFFSNPIKDLEDLFFYIQESLKCEYTKQKHGYSLRAASLSIHFRRETKGVNISEQLRIRKKWIDSSEEEALYVSKYVEQGFYEQKERERMRSEPESESFYRDGFDIPAWDRTLSKETDVESINIVQLPQCTLEYRTHNLGRGLRTLASLKMIQDKSEDDEGEQILAKLYSEMAKKADWLLISQLGKDRKKWEKNLRRGKARVEIPFKKKFEEVDPPWIAGYSLADLCRIYYKKK